MYVGIKLLFYMRTALRKSVGRKLKDALLSESFGGRVEIFAVSNGTAGGSKRLNLWANINIVVLCWLFALLFETSRQKPVTSTALVAQ